MKPGMEKSDLSKDVCVVCSTSMWFKSISVHIRYLKASLITEALSGLIFKYLGFLTITHT